MKLFAFFALAVLAASFVCAVEMPVVLKKTDVYAVSPENSVRLEGAMGQWLAQTLKGVESLGEVVYVGCLGLQIQP